MKSTLTIHRNAMKISANVYSRKLNSFKSRTGSIATLMSGVALLVSIPAEAEVVQTEVAQSTNAYPPQEVQVYVESCVSSATAQGLEQDFAQNYCTCTINTFQERYTYAEFAELALSAQTASQPPAELMEVVELCLQ